MLNLWERDTKLSFQFQVFYVHSQDFVFPFIGSPGTIFLPLMQEQFCEIIRKFEKEKIYMTIFQGPG